MSSRPPSGLYTVQVRDNRTGHWKTTETLEPRKSQKTTRWLYFFSATETILLDSTEDIRVQAVEKAKAYAKPIDGSGADIRVQEEIVGQGWRCMNTIWENGKWVND